MSTRISFRKAKVWSPRSFQGCAKRLHVVVVGMGLLAGCENQADDSEPPSPHSILEARLHETEIEIAVGVLTNPDSVLSSKLFDPEFDRERSELKSVLQTAKTTHK